MDRRLDGTKAEAFALHEDAIDFASRVLAAAADPVRLRILVRLAEHGEMTVGALSEPFDISAPAISRHLRVLEAAGLISRRANRQWRICALNPEPVATAAALLATLAKAAK